MSLKNISVEGMNKWGSNDPNIAKKAGFDPLPVVKFGDYEYIILRPALIHPGHNTAEVVNVTEFNSQSENFKILVTEPDRKKHSVGNAWVTYGEEGGVFALTVFTPKNTITHIEVRTAVLSYRIVEPTRDDVREVRSMLDQELEDSVFQSSVETMIRLEGKMKAEIPAFLRRFRQERGWSQAELGW